MAKQDLRRIKEQKKKPPEEAVKMAEKMMGKKVDLSDKEMGDVDRLTEVAKQYEGKSEGELMGELFKMADQGRKDGSFNNEMLDTFYRSMAPMMNGDQKKKLDSLMKQLKK